MGEALLLAVAVVVAVIFLGILAMIVKCYRKVEQGTALVRTGLGGPQVSFSGKIVLPIIHRFEILDISVKRIEISRAGEEGLICRDNMRADIKVVFFVRVNNTAQDVLKVAQSLGCERASLQASLVELFDAKFSEALKTIGKQFDFVELYNERERFKEQIINMIGTDLNGYILEDVAIDFLEQTPLESLNPNNILDAEGIKKITDLTAKQQILSNNIRREKEKIIRKQDVEAREAILELERQQAEAEAKQKREIESLTAREEAETAKIRQEEKLRSERARIITEEEIKIAEENKDRQILIARKNKERADVMETERVEKDRLIELTERERIVSLAQIERDKAIEIEKKAIQDTIRERVIVERAVVEEQEKIKDTEAFAQADRQQKVAVTLAEQKAEEERRHLIITAEGRKVAAEHDAAERLIKAEAERDASKKETEAKKMLAEAVTAEAAAKGLAEVQVMEAKASAIKKEGEVAAEVMRLKYASEAQGIHEKAEAMKLFDGVGREHEEFKLRLEKEKDIDLAAMEVQKSVAREQAQIIAEALKSARIDIVGGEAVFFDRIVNAITTGKQIDRAVENSQVLGRARETFLSGDSDNFKEQLGNFISAFGIGSEDIKNLSIAALIGKMLALSKDDATGKTLNRMLDVANEKGLGNLKVSSF